MGWMDYDVGLWADLRDEARETVRKKLSAPIYGFDIRRDAVEFSRTNAKAAGVGHLLNFDRRDVRDFHPPDGPPGTILCNPPYGERLGEEDDLRLTLSGVGASVWHAAARAGIAVYSRETWNWLVRSGCLCGRNFTFGMGRFHADCAAIHLHESPHDEMAHCTVGLAQ